MTQIKVDNIADAAGTSAPDFEDGLTVAGSAISTLNTAEYYESGTEPSSPKNGAIWKDTANDKLMVYIAGEFKEVELGASNVASWTVDLSNVTYDSVSFSVAAQEANPWDVEFNNDGTKMYVTGFTSDDVHQYSLSTAFDISTASYDSVFITNSLSPNPRALVFNTDGTKLYFVGNSSDNVLQYSLTTAFDLSTASYDSVLFNVGTENTSPYDLKFNTDGTKMYMLGGADGIYQYSLSTGFDLSTASYDSVSFSVTSQDSNANGMHFNPDGTSIYLVGDANNLVYKYTLSTGFDISTASYDGVSFSVSSQSSVPQGITFNADGTKMYVLDGSSDTLYQYSTGL